jgi:hypothetical protein
MSAVLAVALGWLVPGGAYLLQRRYLQFAGFAVVVSTACAAGMLLGAGCRWPQPAELAGLDSFTALAFQAAALVKLLAGAPFFLARLTGGPGFLDGRLHEYGTTLLMMAGGFNLLGIASAFDLRKERR